MDMLQFNSGSWARYSNHLKRDKPTGSNMLFEDGHVSWYNQGDDPSRPNKRSIDLGATLGAWQCCYRIFDPEIPENR